MVFGVDDAIIGGVIAAVGTAASAASSAAQARATNRANMQINAQNNEQAWDMYHDTRQYDIVTRAEDMAYNSAEALAARNFSADEAAKARGFNADQAQVNREFQERMSNTQYQRAVMDMKEAGLNPMLAYSQGGAGNVGGSAASGPAASGPAASTGTHSGSMGMVPSKIPMQQANFTGAVQAADVGLRMMRQKAEIENIEADSAVKASQVPQSMMATRKMEAEVEQLVQLRPKIEAEIRNIKTDTFRKEVEADVGRAYERLLDAQSRHEVGKAALTEVETAKRQLEKVLSGYAVNAGKAADVVNRSAYGEHVRPPLEAIGEIIKKVSPFIK